MSTIFSLAHLTVLDLPPTEVVRVAARTGYQYVGLRLIAVTETTPGYPLMDDPSMMRGTKSALADTGVGVLDIEFVKITPEIDVTGSERFVAAGAELGAKYVITAPNGVVKVTAVRQLVGHMPSFESRSTPQGRATPPTQPSVSVCKSAGDDMALLIELVVDLGVN